MKKLRFITKHSKNIIIAEILILLVGTIVTFANISPEIPQNVKVIDDSDCVNELSWDSSKNAKFYRIYRSEDDEKYKCIGTTSKTFFTDETDNDNYHYKISACLLFKRSKTSEESSQNKENITNNNDILTEQEAVDFLRDALKQRKNIISLNVYTDKDIKSELFESAICHTGIPNEGDYIKFQFKDLKAKTEFNGNVESITYHAEYYSTAEQEKEVDKKTKEIINSLNLQNKSDYEKIKIIHDYLKNNIAYDTHQYSDNNVKRTAYSALIKNETICQGYALAFYRLLLEAGIDNRIIYGEYTSILGNTGLHTWNLVKCGDKYYYTDVTKDDSQHINFSLHSSKDFSQNYKPLEFDENTYTISDRSLGKSFDLSVVVINALNKMSTAT